MNDSERPPGNLPDEKPPTLYSFLSTDAGCGFVVGFVIGGLPLLSMFQQDPDQVVGRALFHASVGLVIGAVVGLIVFKLKGRQRP